jgi:hypothetical protein
MCVCVLIQKTSNILIDWLSKRSAILVAGFKRRQIRKEAKFGETFTNKLDVVTTFNSLKHISIETLIKNTSRCTDCMKYTHLCTLTNTLKYSETSSDL